MRATSSECGWSPLACSSLAGMVTGILGTLVAFRRRHYRPDRPGRGMASASPAGYDLVVGLTSCGGVCARIMRTTSASPARCGIGSLAHVANGPLGSSTASRMPQWPSKQRTPDAPNFCTLSPSDVMYVSPPGFCHSRMNASTSQWSRFTCTPVLRRLVGHLRRLVAPQLDSQRRLGIE